MQPIKIGNRTVGPGHPCFIIAEAGVNHNGSMEMALQLIDVAVAAGADAVKFQTFTAEGLVSEAAPKAAYQLQNTDAAESQYAMLKRLELTAADFRVLADYCLQRGILFMSTPFDEASVDLLFDLDIAVYKIPSGEVTNLPFLTYVATKGKPMVVSTGMTNLGEVEAAVVTIEAAGHREFVLLHCVSNYPADPADANLRAMQTMEQAFGVPVGFSDHTEGMEVSLAAVALGACAIEKHFTLDRSLPGPDHQASLEPGELTSFIRGIRTVELALGDSRKRLTAGEVDTAAVARKSLVAAHDIPAGTVLTEAMLTTRRPGTGIPPTLLHFVVGRSTRAPLAAGTLVTLDLLA